MLRGLVFLVIALSIVFTTQAQSLEFETVRTETYPGFFGLKVFPGPDLKPISVQTVYVTNFKNSKEAAKYDALLSLVNTLGHRIITAEEADSMVNSTQHRLVWLGQKTNPNQLHFEPAGGDMLEEFEVFSNAQLGPVYLTNLKLKFGGNVSEVYPQHIPFVGEETIVYGKFERPVKTRLSIEAGAGKGEIAAVTPIYLDEYEPLAGSFTLAEDWEIAYKQSKNLSQGKSHADFWLNAFPWLLFLLGVGLIVFGSIHIFRTEKIIKPALSKIPKLNKDWWEHPIEETPLYQSWEDNLPFEVVEKKKG